MRSQWAARLAASTNRFFIVAGAHAPYLGGVSEIRVNLTENAARRIAWIAERQHKPAILRLSVDGGGCAGFTYRFELAQHPDDDDEIAETDGVKLIVDPVSLELVQGSCVDFVEDLGGAAFRVTNPNAQSGCGCGSSFSV
jgi:iron-sulfur cluster assembly accessory protein